MFKRLLSNLAGSRRATPDGGPLELVELAAAAHRRGERMLARELYLQALQLDPQNANALHLLGVLDYKEHNFDDAVELIERAIALQPDAAVYWMNCGLAYIERGQAAEAVARLRAALRLRPAYPKAHANLLFALNFSANASPAAIVEEHRKWYRTNVAP